MPGLFRFGQFELRSAQRALVLNGEPIRLGGRAFDILLALVERRDRIVDFDELLDAVWPGLAVEENNLSVHVSALRKVLGAAAITTIRGKGYQFTAPTLEVTAPTASRGHAGTPVILWHKRSAVLAVRPLLPAAHFLDTPDSGRVLCRNAEGLTLVFERTVDASRAALGIQRAAARLGDGSATIRPSSLRIGLVSTDLGADDERLHEAGNHAHALANVAQDAEIVMTADLAADFVSGIDGDIEDLGDVQLAVGPVRAYRLRPYVASAPVTSPLLPGKQDLRPSIAVLPFEGLFLADPDDLLGEAVAEDVITCLSRSPEFSVISGLSSRRLKRCGLPVETLAGCLSATYLLCGTYKIASGRISLKVHLQDARHGTVVHSLQCEAEIQEAFDTVFPLGQRIGHDIGQAIFHHAIQQSKARPLLELENYVLLMGAISLMHRAALKEFERAREMLEHLTRRPDCVGVASAWMAKWHVLRAVQGWSLDAEADAQHALDCADRSLQEDSRDALALSVCGLVHAYLRKDLQTAGRLYEEAIDANPSEPLAWLFTATRLAYLGEGPKAEEASRTALQLSPIDPMKYFFDSLAATSALANSNWDRSVELGERSIKANRTHASTWRTLAFALVMLGRMDEARHAVQRLLSIEPGFSVGRFKERFPGRDGPMAGPWAEALMAAGLPA